MYRVFESSLPSRYVGPNRDGGITPVILKAHERNALLFDVFVRRLAKQAPFPSLRSLADVWKKAADEKLPGRQYEDGNVSCFIGDAIFDEGRQMVTVLIKRVDKRAPNAAYAHTETRALRILPKEQNEGAEFACHVTISLVSQNGQPNTYAGLVEQVPGIPFVRVQAILNDALRRHCKDSPAAFDFADPSGAKDKATGNIKRKPFTPNIILAGHFSDNFISDLDNGQVVSLQLIKPGAQAPFGQSGFMKLKDYRANISVSKDFPKGNRLGQIVAAAQPTKHEYPQLRIALKPPGEDRAVSVEIDSDSGNPVSEFYIKAFKLGPISPMMENSSENIVERFDNMMKARLANERAL